MAGNIQNWIQQCGTPQCKLCRNRLLDTDITFHSNLSKLAYTCEFRQNCKTSMVIYLISCKHPDCCMKYVGRTKCAINRRLSLHRANIVFGTEGTVMLKHFTEIHNPSDMIIKAIEVCTNKNIDDREKYWIAELNTIFPYGLNDRVYNKGILDSYSYVMDNTSTNLAIYELFNKVPSRRTNKGSRNRSSNSTNSIEEFHPALFMESLSKPNHPDTLYFINYVRSKIMGLNKVDTKSLFLHLTVSINEHNNNFLNYISCKCSEYLPFFARDIAFAKLKVSYSPKSSHHYMVIEYCNKYVDCINLNKIIKNKSISTLFPTHADHSMKTPKIAYKYNYTIRSKIVNYKNVINQGITPTSCNCNQVDGNYIDVNSGHVFTGNLDIIDNMELQKLMKKGLNFREIPPPNKEITYNAVISGIDTYINKISNRINLSLATFKPWKVEILKQVKNTLNKLNTYNYNNVLSKKENINALKRLQNKWVFVPTDKASNNITVVCKKYYMDTLDNEILHSGNFTEDCHNNTHTILDKHVNFLKKFNLQTNNKIPFLYWIAKLHKDPIDHRFITSGRGCSIQPLSIKIGYCLKALLKIIRNNSNFYFKKHKINKCFIVDNRNPVISFMKTCNQGNNVHSISTFDFKKLYTSIPHLKLKNMISRIIETTFALRKKSYISVSGNNAYMTVNKSKSVFSASVHELIECVNFIIDNSFITYKGKLYRQCVGIPMGTNCAPYLANLFLYAYEEVFLTKMCNENKVQVAKQLSYIFRYQDDCIVFNDNGTFHSVCDNIYPAEMQLDKTNVGNSCTFLDLYISIKDGKFIYKSYDKRLYFNFEIINYPDLDSNIPTNPSYGVFSSQLIRFCDINNKLDDFALDVNNLVKKLVKQNFDIQVLKSIFHKFCNNELKRWSKFGTNIYNII